MLRSLYIYTLGTSVFAYMYIDNLGNDDHRKPQTRVVFIVPNI